MGAWIEIDDLEDPIKITSVAPFMGAWIEIKLRGRIIEKFGSRTLYGCVDWNIPTRRMFDWVGKSHPLWVRGLKYSSTSRSISFNSSHPLWVRGLKYLQPLLIMPIQYVAPFMGAWIEITPQEHLQRLLYVAPFMGAWIEIQ